MRKLINGVVGDRKSVSPLVMLMIRKVR